MTYLKSALLVSAAALMASACATTYSGDTESTSMTEVSSMTTKTDTMVMADNKMVGGAEMFANKTIVENASAAPNLTTLVSAVTQAGLVETLSGPGPFTVFAPTNDAFAAVGDTVNTLMMPENKDQLVKVLTAHVVAGKVDATTLIGLIESNGGSYTAETVSGDSLTFYIIGGDVKIADESGRLATVTTADVMQSNGVVHVINSVLVPK